MYRLSNLSRPAMASSATSLGELKTKRLSCSLCSGVQFTPTDTPEKLHVARDQSTTHLSKDRNQRRTWAFDDGSPPCPPPNDKMSDNTTTEPSQINAQLASAKGAVYEVRMALPTPLQRV